jgi:hypothetical protein
VSPRRTALVGAVAFLVVGELVARLQGDRLCSDRPGVVYERSTELGWRHAPDLSGWVGTCDGDGVPPVPVETDSDGLVGPPRPRDKPPGTVRFLLLGGNVPEGFGVPQDLTIARLLELYADERRGRRLEVLNGATGGWALDNSLAFFRSLGAARQPDLVLLVIDPVADLVSLSPAHLAALGRRVPAKPYFSLADGHPVATPPFALAPGPARAEPPGLLAWSALYRLLLRDPGRRAEPMAWAAAGTFPHATPDEEREHDVELARALLATLRDEVAAAGGRLVAVVAALPGATGPDATGKVERERLLAVAGELGIPVLDLTARLASVERQGYRLHLPNSVRLSGAGHTLAAGYVWSFLVDNHLLPPGLVPARVAGSGHAIPDLASLPRALAETLWASRHDLIGRFIQFGLLAVCVVWLSAPLPAAARDWVLVTLGAAMLWLLGTRDAVGLGVGLAIVFYGVVELLPPIPAAVATTALLAGFVAVTARAHAVHAPGESWQMPVLLAASSSIALLKLISYAVDRRRGASRLPLRAFLASMLFFPTLPAGPVDRPVAFASRRGAGSSAPAPAGAASAAARLVVGWLQFTLAPAFLALGNTDVFATRGDAFGRGRLWLFVAEVALLFTLLLAGWSNVAIGLARLAGDTPPENLRRPWLATSVAEFWRRWHASLSAWLRDYVYVPLGGGRRGAIRNVAVAFLVAAAWYGWSITKILGYQAYPPRAWRRLLLCALFNAVAVAGVHLLGRSARDAGSSGVLGTAWRVGATAAVVSLAWLPMMLPLWNRLPDLAGVYLRLFFVR